MQKYVVNTPVTDLRKEPQIHAKVYEKDPLQESQLIFGEHVLGIREEGEWIFIEVLEQCKHMDNSWRGYPGWVLKEHLTLVKVFPPSDLIVDSLWQKIYEKPDENSQILQYLPFGTSLELVNEFDEWWKIKLLNGKMAFSSKNGIRKFIQEKPIQREEILRKGLMFVDAPYLWGGRSAYEPSFKSCITSVDCSGLTSLLYRICGISIARDAHDQYLQCKIKNYDELLLGDLMFSASIKRPERISHVMMVAGPELLLEASMEPKCVRLVRTEEKFGVGQYLKGKESGVKMGKPGEEVLLYFGSILD